jgi:hypothetical protein
MTTPIKTVVIIPPQSGTPIVDANGILTPAWRSYFSQVLTPRVNQLTNTAITSVNTAAQNGIVVSQTQTDNTYSQLLSLEQNLSLASFNGITGLSTSTPVANAGTGGVGIDTTVSRADHFHPASPGTGTVTSVSLSPANGFSGSVATSSTTPVITLTCSVAAGMVKSSGTGLVAAVAGADFVAPAGALGTPASGNLINCIFPVYAVGSLPSGVQGMRAMVNNALTPAFGVAVVAGGSVVTPVFYNGSQWVVG